ncbi:MAG: T9SS type A sorting domain-containing protein [Ignavibacteria bacterium]
MKRLFVILLMLVTMSVNGQWIRQNSGTTNNLWDVYFLNLNTGWACGDTKIYKTTNGGKNWVTQLTPAQNYISQIHAVDSNIVYAAGWFTFLKTTNGGTNWIGIMAGTFGSGLPVFEGLYFLNANTGWLCGSLYNYKTTNGGLTFDSVFVDAELTDIYFKNELEGICSGEYNIQRTTNGGFSWYDIILPWQWQETFLRVSFYNDLTGFVVGGGGITLKSTDFGISWDSVGRVITDRQIYSSIFTSENIGYAGGSFGVFFKTTNGGRNWGFQDTNGLGRGYIKSFWAYNDSILWAVGGGGKILHTTTGGQWLVGINNITTEVPKGFVLYQNYPNPFNPTTNIKFSIVNSGDVKLVVYDIQGREVQTLVNESLKPGTYEAAFDGSALNSGVYFYKLVTGNFTETKKMLLVK